MTPRVAFPIIASLWLAAAAAQTPRPPQTPAPARTSIVTTTSVVGHVTDSTGAAVPGAQIQATNKGTGRTATAKADVAGNYRIDVLPGTYDIEVSSPGFARVLHKDVVASLNATLRLDSRLGARTRPIPTPPKT